MTVQEIVLIWTFAYSIMVLLALGYCGWKLAQIAKRY